MNSEQGQQQIIEYQELSEDRRRAVEIFIKGFVIVVAIIAFGFKLLVDAKDIISIIILGGCGFILGVIGVFYLFRCKKHNKAINKRLNELAKSLGFSNVISILFIFNVAFIAGMIIEIAWLAVIIIMILKLI